MQDENNKRHDKQEGRNLDNIRRGERVRKRKRRDREEMTDAVPVVL